MKEQINERDLKITQSDIKYKEIELKITALQNDQTQKKLYGKN